MADDLKLIKERIYVDEQVETILRELGCEYIDREQNGYLITASLPDGNNRRSIQIKNNESLTANIRSRGITGDIYSVVGYCLYKCQTFDELMENLTDVKKWICDTLGYSFGMQDKKKKNKDWNGWLKKLKKKRSKQIEILENVELDESILDEFDMRPNIWWEEDGIDIDTQTRFEVGFDIHTKRIVFPVRNKDGKLIGVKGRYVGDDAYQLEHRKYLYLYPCNKSVELFNLHRALPYIQERKEVIVVEGAKTTMLLDQFGFEHCVSIEGDQITPAQIKLLKDLGMGINIVFAWDKGKEIGFIKKQVESLTRSRDVAYIYDHDDFLTNKQSPVDMGYKVWYNLYSNYKYNI